MGVYFVAWKGLKKRDVDAASDSTETSLKDSCSEDIVVVAGNADCPQNAEGLEVGASYEFEAEQWFRVSANRHEYWNWLNQLADLVSYYWENLDADGIGPFGELIHYGPHAGTIGTIASAKLVADFDRWDQCAQSFTNDTFYKLYAFMRSMFQYAATDGAVALRSC
ncbi:hypothetical protein WK18_01035 [Burkholderia ubonensis]|uniref:hypothetical protein n=1 Tax=Burkholderia ubonensis TaxID=101571 RepID=UPI000758200E|nr:hypothetical protein [Burkholderia ubonensis]KVR56614.1 hypothetical protein WK18_01035 [Burkholderia ubonensis]KWB80876.1 hypothetical protein WL41_04415 [Burkholderia ubonensis]KWC61823.1 hypothetical protein WL53_00440 [Burkholderia ubonensis]OJA27926.1 hypothetical protein BGX87_20295 [Burkholderia ubonensis]